MAIKNIETIISEKIAPHLLNESGKSRVAKLTREFSHSVMLESIDIGTSQYFRYDDSGIPTLDSVANFISKLGGIANNLSKSPVDQAVDHLRNICKIKFHYWDDNRWKIIFREYIYALKQRGYTDEQILVDLKTDVKHLCDQVKNWSEWTGAMKKWIQDINQWSSDNNLCVEQNESILPNSIFETAKSNIQSICKQINASYENNLFDCTAVMMRRLLESLLVLMYQENNIEDEIIEKSGYHSTLDKIIKNAEQNTNLSLSKGAKTDMRLFKDLGNFSAHKIWYNSTKQDIEPHILKYRTIVEELMYKTDSKT